MAVLDDFASSCMKHPGLTLSDQAFTFKETWDPAQLASLKAQMRRAMAPGGKYRNLAEQGIVIPGPTDKGDWTVGLAKAPQNNLPVSLESNAMSELRSTDKSRLTTRYREHLTEAQETNLTGRKGVVINNALVVGINEYERQHDKIEALTKMLADRDARIVDLQAQVAFLQDMLRNHGGPGVPQAAQ